MNLVVTHYGMNGATTEFMVSGLSCIRTTSSCHEFMYIMEERPMRQMMKQHICIFGAGRIGGEEVLPERNNRDINAIYVGFISKTTK
jgi:hypothetical protein